MENFETSNPGYAWNWDENSLKGKLIGGIFVETYSVIEGKEVMYVSLVAKNIRTVDCIRRGNYKMPDPIKKNGATGNVTPKGNNSSNDFMSIPKGSEEEIPF